MGPILRRKAIARGTPTGQGAGVEMKGKPKPGGVQRGGVTGPSPRGGQVMGLDSGSNFAGVFPRLEGGLEWRRKEEEVEIREDSSRTVCAERSPGAPVITGSRHLNGE